MFHSIGLTLIWFLWINPKLQARKLSPQSIEAALGQKGTVVDFNQKTQRGHIRFITPVLGSSDWEMISEDIFQDGDKAKIIDVSGNRLVVKRIKPKGE